ncbi:MAG TPA: hypothetical protein VNL35_00370 [Chloroflexota bacterium]|nr:hypothetical protein [Chloroflexota bacterium]
MRELVAELSAVLSEAVSARIERWEVTDLGTIEAEAQQVFRQVGGVLLGALARARVAEQAGERPVCPTCGGAGRLVEGARPRRVQGLVGEVTVRRPYYHCAACRTGTAPLDVAWGRGRGVRTVVVLGDGADWIWRQACCQLGRPGLEVVEIVDFFHACEHLSTVAHAVWGAGDLRAHDWLAPQRPALRHQGVRSVRRALGKLRPRTATAADEVRKARRYFRTHDARMHDPAFRARQFPIGSGAIESTAKNMIQARQTPARMRWSLLGAPAVASLRAVQRSGRWAAFWQSQPQCRLRLVPEGRAATAPEAAQPTGEDAPASCPFSPPAAPITPPRASPPPETPAPLAPRIQTAGKPWWPSRAWADHPIGRPRSA